MRQKRLSKASVRLRPQTWYAAVAVAAAATLYLFHLGRFIGQGPAELQAVAASGSLGSLAANPINLPHKLLEFIALQLPFGSEAFRGRLGSVLLALLAGACFFFLVQRWHGMRNAVLATALFVTSSWMLQTGRFGASLVLFSFLVLGLAALAAWIANAEARGSTVIWIALAGAAALTVSAGIWFLLAVILIIRPQLLDHITAASRTQLAVAGGILLAGLAVVATAVARDPQLVRQWLGLPAELPMLAMMAKYAAASLLFVVGRGPFMPEVWLAHTPLLDAAMTAVFVLGVLFYAKRHANARVRLLMSFAAISAVLITLNGAPALAYLVPIVYLVAATGLAYLLHQWLQVFPRNPIARGLAFTLVAVLVTTTVSYHTQRYFIAWRNSPDTAEAYRSDDSDLQAANLIQ